MTKVNLKNISTLGFDQDAIATVLPGDHVFNFGFFERFRVAFREWRERRRVHATLSGLSDWELLDIGTTRGEIDYVASHRDIDPRGVLSAE